MKNLISLTLASAALGACSVVPPLEPSIKDIPYGGPAYQHNDAPTLAPTPVSASLWSTASNSLLSMRRAKDVGDLLTVVVEMNDRASLQNSLTRSRSSSDDLNVDAMFGLPEWANSILPGGATVSPGIDVDRTSDMNGSGAINRAEKITFQLACRVVGVEPNGNLIIQGYQQTRVSNEVRYLVVTGVIRAQDITRTNTVSYEKIADANLSYVSNGEAMGAIERGLVPKALERFVPF